MVIPTVSNMDNLKQKIKNTAKVVGTHILSGGNVHVVAEKDDALEGIKGGTIGFMSSEDYLEYLAIQKRLNALRELVEKYQIPSGTCLWYDADITQIPEGWHLVEDPDELDISGRAIRGVSGENKVGTTASATGKESVLSKLVPMHLICKD